MPLGIAVQAGDRRHEKGEHGDDHQSELRQERTPVDSAAAGDHRQPEYEQQVGDDRARDRATDDVRESVPDREDGDDQLRGVAKARVQEPADSRPRVLGKLLGRLAYDPGKRDEGGRGEHEDGDVAGTCEVMQCERNRGEGKRGRQEPARRLRRTLAHRMTRTEA